MTIGMWDECVYGRDSLWDYSSDDWGQNGWDFSRLRIGWGLGSIGERILFDMRKRWRGLRLSGYVLYVLYLWSLDRDWRLGYQRRSTDHDSRYYVHCVCVCFRLPGYIHDTRIRYRGKTITTSSIDL